MRRQKYNYFDDDPEEEKLQEEIQELVDGFTESQEQVPTLIEHKAFGHSQNHRLFQIAVFGFGAFGDKHLQEHQKRH